MNIYKIKMQGEEDFVCAGTIIGALQLLHTMAGLEIYDYDSSDEITQVEKSDWSKLTFENDNKKTITFSEFMKTAKTPNIICSTAY